MGRADRQREPRLERRPDVRARSREETVSPIQAGIEGIGWVLLLAAGVGLTGFVLSVLVALVY